MASIRKINKTTWEIAVYVGRDVKGKHLRKYATARSEKEAKEIARELEGDVASRDLSNVSMMKMVDWMEVWMDVSKPLLSPTTIKAYRLYVDKHFVPAFEKLKVCDITDMHVKSYIADKLADLSPTTVRKHFFTLQKILRDALKHASPCIGIKPPKTGNYKPTVPTEAQFKTLQSTFAEISMEHEAVILLAGWCGLRRGEIFALKWDDIDEKKGSIRIDEALALTEDEYKFEFKEPKSANGVRIVAAPDNLIELLKKIKKSPKKKKKRAVVNIEEKKQEKQEESDIAHSVFTITPGSWSNLYAKVIREKKLPKVRFHDLRHYHASILYKNNVPDLYAAERLGHDVWVLKKIYQHLGLEEKKELDDKVKGLFK